MNPFLRRLSAAAAVVCALASPEPARGQSADQVAVVINETHDGSRAVGEYYARRRSVPDRNVIRIETVAEDSIDRAAYVSTIEQPIAAALARAGLQDRILYLVLTTGIPLRINGSPGQEGTLASVDSELTLLYRRMTGQQAVVQASVENPYFLGTRPITEARPFSRQDHDIYLVTRLDAFTVQEATALVDRAGAAADSADGGGNRRIVLDQRGSRASRLGDEWMDEARVHLTDLGHGDRVVLEPTSKSARDVVDVVGYFSWGSTDPENRQRRTGLTFVPGALAANIVGSDARTFREPPPDWIPGAAPTRATAHVGTAESLIGDLIREGVTGVAGNVAEAYFAGNVRPQILFPAYLAGFNLAESFYLSLPRLSWRTVIVGDPLAKVASREGSAPIGMDSGVDPVTQLPALFSARRVKAAASQARGIPESAVALSLRAEALSGSDDVDGARAALLEALKIAPRYTAALMRLALFDEQAELHESAIARYRQVLEIEPGHVIAMNNLAFRLTAQEDTRNEALRWARRAAALAPSSSDVLDTLAWVLHLLGDSAEASRIITTALRETPDRAGLRVHAAAIFASAGRAAEAEAQLKEALRLDPSLESSEDVRSVRQSLQTSPR